MAETPIQPSFMAEVGAQQMGRPLSVRELRLHFPQSFRFAQGNKPGEIPTQKNIFRAMHALHRDWRVALNHDERLQVLGYTSDMADKLVSAGAHTEFAYAEKPEYIRNLELTPEEQERFEEAVDLLGTMKEVLNGPTEENIEDIIPELAVNMLQADKYFITRDGGRGISKGDNYKSYILTHAILRQETGDPFFNELFKHIGSYLRELHTKVRTGAGTGAGGEFQTYMLFLDVISAYNDTHEQQVTVGDLFKEGTES